MKERRIRKSGKEGYYDEGVCAMHCWAKMVMIL